MTIRTFSGLTAVVTGASDGIGRAIARALAEAGATVYALARSADKLQALQSEYPAAIIGLPVDLSDPLATDAAFMQIKEASQGVDILVNNVGGGTFKPLDAQSRDEVLLAVDLPYRVAVQACHAFVPAMRSRGSGHIVNLTSPAGYVPFPFMAPYVASRHAMKGLSLSLNDELRAYGINSLLFCPAEVNTGYFERNDTSMDWYPRVSGIFPVLEPEDVAREVLRALRKGQHEKIYPLSLALFIRAYQLMPKLSVAVLRLLGLWRPRVDLAPSKTTHS